MSLKRLRFQHLALGLTAVLLFIAAGPLRLWTAHGATLGARSLQLNDNRASASSNYVLTLAGQTTGTVGSLRAQFCSNDPLIGTACIAPAGFSLAGASLTAQSGMGGFAIDTANSTNNVLVLTRAPGPSVPGTSSYTLGGVVNPSTAGSYYVRLETFASTDASGGNSDYGGLAFPIGNVVDISTYVPPYMLFCVGTTIQSYDCSTANGDYIDFGDFRSNSTASAETQMLVVTNAGNGYSIRAVGTTLTSGNNEIPPLTNSDVSRVGVSQFGLNLRSNATPAVGANVQGPGSGTVASGYNMPDFYKFVSGDVLASSPTADDYRLYTASYVVNVAKSQPAGIYVSTITYISLANF